jgi:hypothetical protein
MNKYERHKEIIMDMNKQYFDKNEAYGDAYSKTLRDIGLIHALGMLKHKIYRFEALIQGAKNNVKDESIVDTLRDMANYSVLTMIEIEGSHEANFRLL